MRRDTICALCTPPGEGALSVIRVSGPKALSSVKPLASFLPSQPASHKAYVGLLKNQDEILDEVVVTYFKQGQSFTGEETLEISCHGGDFVSHKILNVLQLQESLRLAKRGEFSLLAFLNGKLDLTQAESILQIIESTNSKSHQMAVRQLKGELSEKLSDIEKKWAFLLSHLEADIDFAQENIQVLKAKDLEKHTRSLLKEVEIILKKHKPFEELQKGFVLGIFGLVNVGKSTLFNALIEEDKSIVTSEQGTTRDPVEGQIFSEKGLNLFLKDTAGFRNAGGEAEKKGQRKTKELLSSCATPLFVLEWKEELVQELEAVIKDCEKRFVLVVTKKDLYPKLTKAELKSKIKKKFPRILEEEIFFVSAKTKEGIEGLKNYLLSFGQEEAFESFFVTNARHFKCIKKMKDSLIKTLNILSAGQEKDLMALELQEGLRAIYEVTGKEFSEQVLDKIFKQFCIGK